MRQDDITMTVPDALVTDLLNTMQISIKPGLENSVELITRKLQKIRNINEFKSFATTVTSTYDACCTNEIRKMDEQLLCWYAI